MHWFLVILSVFLFVFFWLWVVVCLPWPIIPMMERLFPDVLFRLYPHSSQNLLMLTIDDSPTMRHTDAILEVLKKHNVTATFFCIGEYAKRHPDALKRIRMQGCVPANHGYTNTAAFFQSYTTTVKSINDTREQIRAFYLRLFRPGCGLFHSGTLRAARDTGFPIMLGSNYPHDPYWPLPRLYAWLVLWCLKPRQIIILHDRAWTPKTLEIILPAIKARGYIFV